MAFRVANGSLLRGSNSGSGNRWAILIAHRGQNVRAWKPLAATLARAGLRVPAFALREQDGADRPAGRQAVEDVLAALRFADRQGARRRYLIGAGSGATAALVAVGKREITALVLFSPRRTLTGIPCDSIRDSAAPKLFFVGSLDTRAAHEGEAVFSRSIGWAVLSWLPVNCQPTDLLTSSWGDELLEETLLFLRDYP